VTYFNVLLRNFHAGLRETATNLSQEAGPRIKIRIPDLQNTKKVCWSLSATFRNNHEKINEVW